MSEEQDLIDACPRCGNLVLISCCHDGTDVSSVLMPRTEALTLLRQSQEDLRARLAHVTEMIGRL